MYDSYSKASPEFYIGYKRLFSNWYHHALEQALPSKYYQNCTSAYLFLETWQRYILFTQNLSHKATYWCTQYLKISEYCWKKEESKM